MNCCFVQGLRQLSTESPTFEVAISDSEFWHIGLLHRRLNPLVQSSQLMLGTVFKLLDFYIEPVQGSRCRA